MFPNPTLTIWILSDRIIVQWDWEPTLVDVQRAECDKYMIKS